jgi:hypothetical protein
LGHLILLEDLRYRQYVVRCRKSAETYAKESSSGNNPHGGGRFREDRRRNASR